MDASGAEDGTDFRPFFDMVIGILFVLLILVAAQIYFEQEQVDTVSSDATKREAALRHADITTFLNALAARLLAAGLTPTVDPENGAILLPLQEVMSVDAGGLPAVQEVPAGRLGTVVAGMISCVTVPRSTDSACPPFGRLGLDRLAVTVRVGTLPPQAALPTDRFGDLGSAMLSAKLMNGAPELVAASSAAGGRVVSFDTASTGISPLAPEAGVSGDVVLDFTFQ